MNKDLDAEGHGNFWSKHWRTETFEEQHPKPFVHFHVLATCQDDVAEASKQDEDAHLPVLHHCVELRRNAQTKQR